MVSQLEGVQTPKEAETYVGIRRPWLVQAAVGVGVAITTMDTSGINLSLHTLGQVFRVDAATVAWLPLVAFLTATSTLLLFGRLSDILGRKRVFLGGFAVYALGSLTAGLAPSFGALLASRGLHALGMSMLFANAQAILTESFPPHKRGSVLGINSAIVGLGLFVGPIVTGTLIATLGWRFVFFASIPLCLVSLVVGWLALPRSGPVVKRGQFDLAGAALFAAAAVSLILAVSNIRTTSLTSPTVLGFASGFGLAIAGFLIVERRVTAPMLDLGLFRYRLFSLSLASAFVLFLGSAGQEFLLPLFIQKVLMMNPATAGLITSVVPFARVVLAWPGGLLSDRLGSRWVSVSGGALLGLGVFLLSRLDANATLPWLLPCLVVTGLGSALYFSPNVHATMSSLPPDKLGTAAAAVALRRNLGQSFGVALAAYLLQSGGNGPSASSFQLAFALQAFCAVLAALVACASGSTEVAPRRGSGKHGNN